MNKFVAYGAALIAVAIGAVLAIKKFDKLTKWISANEYNES